jgi:hypothetical protein
MTIMGNKLDKLFRDKLENHSMQPSAQAWEKVAASFPKKNNTIVWAWRIAAAVAIFGLIGWYALSDSEEQLVKRVAKETPALKKQEPKKVEEQNTEVKISNDQKPKPSTIKRPETVINKPEPVALVNSEPKESTSIETSIVETVASVKEIKKSEATPETVAASGKAKPMVIVYTLASVETRQEVEPAKVNGFKKVIEFAKNVKGGETTLASVRHWKDDFLGSEEQVVEKQNNN